MLYFKSGVGELVLDYICLYSYSSTSLELENSYLTTSVCTRTLLQVWSWRTRTWVHLSVLVLFYKSGVGELVLEYICLYSYSSTSLELENSYLTTSVCTRTLLQVWSWRTRTWLHLSVLVLFYKSGELALEYICLYSYSSTSLELENSYLTTSVCTRTLLQVYIDFACYTWSWSLHVSSLFLLVEDIFEISFYLHVCINTYVIYVYILLTKTYFTSYSRDSKYTNIKYCWYVDYRLLKEVIQSTRLGGSNPDDFLGCVNIKLDVSSNWLKVWYQMTWWVQLSIPILCHTLETGLYGRNLVVRK